MSLLLRNYYLEMYPKTAPLVPYLISSKISLIYSKDAFSFHSLTAFIPLCINSEAFPACFTRLCFA